MQIWIYKLVCKDCGHSEIDEFLWESCPTCGKPYEVDSKWPGGK